MLECTGVIYNTTIVDGFTNTHDIANNFHSKFSLNFIDENMPSFSFLQDTNCMSNISIVPQCIRSLGKTENQQAGSQTRIHLNLTIIDPLLWPPILVRFLNGVYCSTFDLQFGFKSGASTDSCTGLLKNIIALHIHCKPKVYG